MTPHLVCCHVCSQTEKKAAAPSNQSAGDLVLRGATHVTPFAIRYFQSQGLMTMPGTSLFGSKVFRGHSIMSPSFQISMELSWLYTSRGTVSSRFDWPYTPGVPTHLALWSWARDRILVPCGGTIELVVYYRDTLIFYASVDSFSSCRQYNSPGSLCQSLSGLL